MTEDFPTPVSPTRRIVYGAFVVLFDVWMIPCLRSTTLLENTIRTTTVSEGYYDLLDSKEVIVVIAIQCVLAWASKIVIRGEFDTEWTAQLVDIHDPDLCGKTHCSGLTSDAVDIEWVILYVRGTMDGLWDVVR
jgi:hypothetical protein